MRLLRRGDLFIHFTLNLCKPILGQDSKRNAFKYIHITGVTNGAGNYTTFYPYRSRQFFINVFKGETQRYKNQRSTRDACSYNFFIYHHNRFYPGSSLLNRRYLKIQRNYLATILHATPNGETLLRKK